MKLPLKAILALTLAVCVLSAAALALADEVEVEVADSAAAVPSAHTPIPEFAATHEWQTVLPGQGLPAGLHVKMDLSTGEKLARLLPDDEINEGTRKLNDRREQERQMGVVAVPACDPTGEVPCDADSSKDSGGPGLKRLPEPGGEAPLDDISPRSEAALLQARQERIRLLKEHFYLKEDVEQMKRLLAICIDPAASVEDVIQALQILEEYLHQIDNANDWSTIGGLDVSLTFLQQNHEPLTESIATTNNDTAIPPAAPVDLQIERLYNLQAHAAWVLGTAAQNNPKVQDYCRKEGAVQVLTSLYERTIAEEDAPGPELSAVSMFQLRSARLKLLSKLLYALSAVLRNNARNQGIFHALHGEDFLLRSPKADWPKCVAGETAAVMRCLSEEEYTQMLKLLDTVTLKRVNLLHDFIIDHTVNSRESVSNVTGATTTARVDISDPKLFAALADDKFCTHYLRVAAQPAADLSQQQLTPVQLSTREMALSILRSLLEHKHEKTGPGFCHQALSSPPMTALLSEIEQQQSTWAAEAALAEVSADEAADGLAEYHRELRDAAAKVKAVLQQ